MSENESPFYVDAPNVLIAVISTIAVAHGVAPARRMVAELAGDDLLWMDIADRLGLPELLDTEPPTPLQYDEEPIGAAPTPFIDEEAVQTALRPSPVPTFAPEPESDPPIEVTEIVVPSSSSAPPPMAAMTEGDPAPAPPNGHPKKRPKARVQP